VSFILDCEVLLVDGRPVYYLLDMITDGAGEVLKHDRVYDGFSVQSAELCALDRTLVLRHAAETIEDAKEHCAALAQQLVPCDGVVAVSRTSMVQYKI
jgi:hypothetical protein